MRLSSSTIFENGVTSMMSRQQELNKTQQHVATGRRVLTPSDDPVASAQVLDLTEAKGINRQLALNAGAVKARLGLDYTASNVLEVKGGKLTGALLGDILDAEGKAAKFREVMSSLRAGKENTIAIGDGANDLKMMKEAGISVAFHAKPVVQAEATCALSWCGLDAVANLLE